MEMQHGDRYAGSGGGDWLRLWRKKKATIHEDLSGDTLTSRPAAVLQRCTSVDCKICRRGQRGDTEEGHEAWAVSYQEHGWSARNTLGAHKEEEDHDAKPKNSDTKRY